MARRIQLYCGLSCSRNTGDRPEPTQCHAPDRPAVTPLSPAFLQGGLQHRIPESLLLEETSGIIEFNLCLTPTLPPRQH